MATWQQILTTTSGALSSDLSNYLLKTGGTLTGNILIDQASGGSLTIDSGGGDGFLQFKNASSIRWSIGRDNTDNALVFNYGDGLGSSGGQLKLAATTGEVTFYGNTINLPNGQILSNSANELAMKAGASASLLLGANDTDQHLIINTSGNVGIGKTPEGDAYGFTSERFLEVGTGGTDRSGVIELYGNTDNDGTGIGHILWRNKQNSFTDGVNYWGSSGEGVGRISLINEISGTGQGDQGSAMTFWTKAAGGDTLERVRIDKSGKVGIGTTSPTQQLHVVSTTHSHGIRIEQDTTHADAIAAIWLNTTQRNWGMVGHSNTGTSDYASIGEIGTGTGGVMHFDIYGKVGIGTTTPSKLLELKSTSDTVGYEELFKITGAYSTMTNMGIDNSTAGGHTAVVFRSQDSSKWAIGNDGSNDNFKIGRGAYPTTNTALTIDTSNDATFAGNVTTDGTQIVMNGITSSSNTLLKLREKSAWNRVKGSGDNETVRNRIPYDQ